MMADESNYVNINELKEDKGLQFVCYNIRSLYHKISSIRMTYDIECQMLVSKELRL